MHVDCLDAADSADRHKNRGGDLAVIGSYFAGSGIAAGGKSLYFEFHK